MNFSASTEWIIAIASILAAIATIWKLLLGPFFSLVATTREMLPLMYRFNRTFRDHPNAFQILNDIATQFRTNGGSSLRDVIDKLEVAADENKVHTAEMMKKVERLEAHWRSFTVR